MRYIRTILENRDDGNRYEVRQESHDQKTWVELQAIRIGPANVAGSYVVGEFREVTPEEQDRERRSIAHQQLSSGANFLVAGLNEE